MNDLVPLVSLRDIILVLFRWKWTITTIFAVTIATTVVCLWLIRDEFYVVTAKVLVKIGLEQTPPTTVLGASPAVIGYHEADVNSEIDILTSSELLIQLIDRLGMDKAGPPPPVPERLLARVKYYAKSAVQWFQEWKEAMLIRIGLRERLTLREKVLARLQKTIMVQTQKDSNVIVANLALPFRENASVVLNALLEDYQRFRLKLYRNKGDEFFEKQLVRISAQLENAEKELQAYERKWQISAQHKQEELLLEQISQGKILLKEAEVELGQAAFKVQRLDEELSRKEPNFGALGGFESDSFQQGILAELAGLEKEREQLRLTELDRSDRVRNNRSQFEALGDLLAANLRSVLAEKQRTYETRMASVVELQSDLDEFHGQQMSWGALKRRARNLENDHLFYRNKLEESIATDAALAQETISNVTVIEHAMDPLAPAGMRKLFLLGLSSMAAAFAALAFVSVAEFFDHRIYTPEALERSLGTTVIAVLPVVKPAPTIGTKLLAYLEEHHD